MNNKKLLGVALLVVIVGILPLVVTAAEDKSYAIDVELFPGSVEAGLELLNVVLAVVAATYSIKLAALAQGGSLEKTWNMLAIAAGVFAALEINNGLKEFGLVHIGGASEILEVIFLILLLVAFVTTRRSLLKVLLGK